MEDNRYGRFHKLLKRDGTNKGDSERTALFYILAGNDDLYSKVDYIYNFKGHMIYHKCLSDDKVDFCSSSRKLIKLAFNLYNSTPADVIDTFYLLDEDNFNLALDAIRIRFNKF